MRAILKQEARFEGVGSCVVGILTNYCGKPCDNVLTMITVVLVRPEHPGNIGAVARVMANFDAASLVLVNPQCDHLALEARNRAKHAQHVLEKAKVVKKIPAFDYTVVTTALTGGRLNPRSPVTPRQLVEAIPAKGKIGLVFGPESTGLSNTEILAADFTVTIPASLKYPTLNVSHSVAILLYELFEPKNETIRELATADDRKRLLGFIDDILKDMTFTRKSMKQTQRIIWKRILGKSFLTKREAYALFGFFKKVKRK